MDKEPEFNLTSIELRAYIHPKAVKSRQIRTYSARFSSDLYRFVKGFTDMAHVLKNPLKTLSQGITRIYAGFPQIIPTQTPYEPPAKSVKTRRKSLSDNDVILQTADVKWHRGNGIILPRGVEETNITRPTCTGETDGIQNAVPFLRHSHFGA